jgi:hypothetical protein
MGGKGEEEGKNGREEERNKGYHYVRVGEYNYYSY